MFIKRTLSTILLVPILIAAVAYSRSSLAHSCPDFH